MPEHDVWFEQLYRENYPRMIRQAACLLGSQAIAEELVQEAFLILLCKEDAVRQHPNPAGWLSVTLKNLLMDQVKSAAHRSEVPLSSAGAGAAPDRYFPSLADRLPASMPEKDRILLTLYYERGLSCGEIAEELGVSPLACGTRLFRARARLKALLDAERFS